MLALSLLKLEKCLWRVVSPPANKVRAVGRPAAREVRGWTVCSRSRGPVYYRWRWPSSSLAVDQEVFRGPKVNEFSRSEINCAPQLMSLSLAHEYRMREMRLCCAARGKARRYTARCLCGDCDMVACVYLSIACSYHFCYVCLDSLA